MSYYDYGPSPSSSDPGKTIIIIIVVIAVLAGLGFLGYYIYKNYFGATGATGVTGTTGVTGCTSDSDCSEAIQSCQQGQCISRALGDSCVMDIHCPPGSKCLNEICSIPLVELGGTCSVPTQCESGFCSNNICRSRLKTTGDVCLNSSECTAGLICQNGFCVSPSTSSPATPSNQPPSGGITTTSSTDPLLIHNGEIVTLSGAGRILGLSLWDTSKSNKSAMIDKGTTGTGGNFNLCSTASCMVWVIVKYNQTTHTIIKDSSVIMTRDLIRLYNLSKPGFFLEATGSVTPFVVTSCNQNTRDCGTFLIEKLAQGSELHNNEFIKLWSYQSKRLTDPPPAVIPRYIDNGYKLLNKSSDSSDPTIAPSETSTDYSWFIEKVNNLALQTRADTLVASL